VSNLEKAILKDMESDSPEENSCKTSVDGECNMPNAPLSIEVQIKTTSMSNARMLTA
jgi:hypothetical protein